MNLWNWRPGGHPLGELEQQMNRLLDLTLNMVGQHLLAPPQPFLGCNLYEAATEYLLLMPLPGVQVDELELHAAGTSLTLKGERKRPADVAEESYRRQERWVGRWSRAVPLPPRADAEAISASLEHGLLLIRIPKQPEAVPHSLPIKVGRNHPPAGPRPVTARTVPNTGAGPNEGGTGDGPAA